MAWSLGNLRGFAHKRYVICVLCFAATWCAYVERTGFSIAFTAMCSGIPGSERLKGMVMSAFYWGYGLSQVPGGFLAQRFGGRRTLLACFAGWTVVSFFTPSNVHNATAIFAARVLIGVFQGLLIPSVHTVLSEWVLPHERAKATSLCTSGMYLGSAAAVQFLPSIASWTSSPSFIFRLVAGIGAVWFLFWAALGEGVKHPYIPETTNTTLESASKNLPATPWARLIRHRAIWAIVANNFAFHYCFYVIMNWMPTYFVALVHKDLNTVGIGKPLPYLVMFLMSNVGGWAGDWLIARGHAVGPARKIVNTIGFGATAVLLLVMPFAETVGVSLTVLSLCLGACGFSRGGFSVNHMDVAPRYAGIVMGISNTAGTVSGLIGVAATGFILEAHGGSSERQGWLVAHAVASVVLLACGVQFVLAGRGTRLFN